MNPDLIVGIIGGTGLMGRWFERFFTSRGYDVLIASRKTELSIEDCARQSDVVIISVPIDAAIDVIKKTAPLMKRGGLLMDFTSVKKEPVDAMLKYSQCEVVGAHPMFGPGVDSLMNQTVILCPARGSSWLKRIEKIFLQAGAKLKVTTPEYHDKMMSVIQGVIHFSSITISHVLKELDIDIAECQEFSSPVYKLRMDMVGRILNQDGQLYGNIEISNPQTTKALKAYLKTCNRLYNIIDRKDLNEFVKYFNEAADYLGDFKKEAEEYSNYLIQKLVHKKRKKGEILK
ncbi:prephenate dehydrogenase/arogenate dehydrogenase family protein [Candidatus Woesearchaeota archaeon]|nr:prephenate dehydrogenase/arogenate dehydrogenase family protein [Candidatus Woesearchaeota archaeon]